MRIFLTGATGFIGSHVLPVLLEGGHSVLGLTRSDEGAKRLAAAGAAAHRGDLDDPRTLRGGAEDVDAIIHCAFEHDFANFEESCRKETRNLEAMAEAFAGSARPMIVTSGVGLGSRRPGEAATEDWFDEENPLPRKVSEVTGKTLEARGINISYLRMPQVHDTRKQGLITPLLEVARAKGRVAYVGEGTNRLAAAHVSDVARLYRLAVERAEKGARWHAVAEEGVPMRAICEAAGRALGLPAVSITADEAAEHFGVLRVFADLDLQATSAITREKLGWTPTGPTLLEDLARLET